MTLLTAHDLASQWNMAPVTIRKMAAEGRLPGAYKIGRDWRFDPVKIDRWFKTRERRAITWQSIKEVRRIGLDFSPMVRKSGNRLEQLLGLSR